MFTTLSRCLPLGVLLLLGCGKAAAPAPAPETPEPTPPPAVKPADELLSLVREAVRRRDYDSIDALRDRPIEEIIDTMVQDYDGATEWPPRDVIVFLYQDTNDPRLAPMMRHALDSPNVETRALAACSLSGDRKMFDTFLVEGKLDEKKVNAAVETARKAKPEQK